LIVLTWPRGPEQRLVDFAIANRIATMCISAEFVRSGVLMSYFTPFEAIFAKLAEYVDRIIKGAKPVDLPVQQPTQFELVINLGTAKALGLTIPPKLLQRADEVIQ
jgi:putative ABC transport system substrate-binding protein